MSPEALRAYYDNVRLTILNGILQTTPMGYRADDAGFLIGSVYSDHFCRDVRCARTASKGHTRRVQSCRRATAGSIRRTRCEGDRQREGGEWPSG
jgi:hypothetical protein